ncbi:MAG TPA: LysM peptidoglycan-binding domain-containing protein [Rhodanobacteraceae bacterium]|nr:LysM peptidoglycan-binding domain-containing protein [Rhodanobacteraceae bacterium]
MLKKSLGFIAGFAVTLAVFAAGANLRPDHPDTYVVKKGDTLWDISARFLNKPWLWPEIWRANPQVHNPHLIYPGDVLNLAYDGSSTVLKLEPGIRASENAIPPIPLDQIKPFLKDFRILSADELEAAPYVMAFEDQHLRGTPGGFLYVRGSDAQPGARFAVVRPSHAYRVFSPGKDKEDRVGHMLDSNVDLYGGPWKEYTRGDGHWGKGDSLGVEVEVIGTAMVQRTGDPATFMLEDSSIEVRKGDRLLPVDNHPYDSMYYPHAAPSLPADARVIAYADALAYAGKLQVVALSVGSSDGIDNGSTFSIYHPGERVRDAVISSNSTFGSKVTLPDEFVGHVLVFRTFDKVSYALIMDSIRPVALGDTLELPQ